MKNKSAFIVKEYQAKSIGRKPEDGQRRAKNNDKMLRTPFIYFIYYFLFYFIIQIFDYIQDDFFHR